MILTLIYFIFILGIVVFIHELGHFLFAKKAGVYVYEFSIGMGPRIFKFKRKKKIKDKNGKVTFVDDETDYCIRLFPIGGFVQMAGEEIEVDENIPKDKRLQSKRWGQRFMVMVAGVMNNFILAFIIILIIGWTNTISLNSVYVADSLVPDLYDGEKIIAVNGHKVNSYDMLSLELIVASKDNFKITVENADGNRRDVVIEPISLGENNLIYGRDYGFTLGSKVVGDKLMLIVKESEIDNLQENEIIVSVNGVEIESHMQLLDLIKNEEDCFLLTTKDQKGDLKETVIEISKNDDDNLAGYSYGFSITGTEEKGFLAGIKYACGKFVSTLQQMVKTVWYLITGDLSLSALSGPVGIFKVVDTAKNQGFMNILSLLALLNINVAFINILPLPAFDGGHALFLIIEKIKGRPLDPKIENTIHNIFFILLMILMLYITFNDIVRIF